VLRCSLAACILLTTAAIGLAQSTRPLNYNVRDFGAIGDGKALDTNAINNTIDAAAAAGGGTVEFPPGTYRSYSIHLQSNITLYLAQGATLLAADSPAVRYGRGRRGAATFPATAPASRPTGPTYDLAEPNDAAGTYQDFGHSHWHNSLIWGENLTNISITGPGTIDGVGLSRMANANSLGVGNKAIGLKSCRNVTIRDISIYRAGHFGILATGVDNLTIDNIKIDTNRDGMDIDCCQHVNITNTTINSPNDDGLVLKSSFALGTTRPTEDVTISDCHLSGYDVGSVLNATYTTNLDSAPDGDGPTGRIKIGTETIGGFKNINIFDCVFNHCRGLALESVDGSTIENVTVSNIAMHDVLSAPIFIRLGFRMRAPDGTPIGSIRNINISNITADNAEPFYSCIITGTPGHDIQDVHLNNIHITYQGGGPKELAKRILPEYPEDYPEPSMFGNAPSYGFFLRHVTGIDLSNIQINYIKDDNRPPFILEDVKDSDFQNIKAKHAPDVPTFLLRKIENFSERNSESLPTTQESQPNTNSF